VDDQESNGSQNMGRVSPTLSLTGNRIGWVAVAPNGKQHLIIDDKDHELAPFNAPGVSMRVTCLTFSPGATHYAYLYGPNVCVDGIAQPGLISGPKYVFSPDDKHIAHEAVIAEHWCFVIDGKIVDKDAPVADHAFFSPDSRHIIWVAQGNLQAQGTKDTRMLYVDGKPVAHYSESGGGLATNFEFSSDGILTFVARTEDNFRRFRVTLPTDTDVSTMLAAAPNAQVK
jgi:hypothetical protein